MWLVKGAPNLMQRLSRLPAPPNVTFLDRRKPKPHPWFHDNTTFTELIYIRWCCIDLSNPPRLLGQSPTNLDIIVVSALIDHGIPGRNETAKGEAAHGFWD